MENSRRKDGSRLDQDDDSSSRTHQVTQLGLQSPNGQQKGKKIKIKWYLCNKPLDLKVTTAQTKSRMNRRYPKTQKLETVGCSTFFISINVLFDSDYVRQYKDRSFLGSCFSTCHWSKYFDQWHVLKQDPISRTKH